MSDDTITALAPWQQRIYTQAAAAIDSGRLGHALLFRGPARLGKGAVARALARRLLCESRTPAGDACGRCRGCQLFAAGTHPDFHAVSFITVKDGSRLRTELIVDQMRELSGQLSLTPQYGGAQVAIIDPADALNNAAANALLKTLEEPQPGRYLWLVAAEPARLPATIRSRCQNLDFRLPPRAEALDWLRSRGHEARSAGDALEAARGHPGLAEAWLADGGLALRREVAADLDALDRGEASPAATAQRWAGDEQSALRLRFAADLALEQAASLTDAGRTRRLASWFDAANRTAALLRTTVRTDLAMAELLLAWPRATGGQR